MLQQLVVVFVVSLLLLALEHVIANSFPWDVKFGWLSRPPTNYMVGTATVGAVFSMLMIIWQDWAALLAFWAAASGGLAVVIGYKWAAIIKDELRRRGGSGQGEETE